MMHLQGMREVTAKKGFAMRILPLTGRPRRRGSLLIALSFLWVVSLSKAGAGTIAWTNWTQIQGGNPGSAQGTITPSGPEITVNYSGDVEAASQLSSGG